MERERPAFGPGRPVYHLYLDSSALVKYYVYEPGTEAVHNAVKDAYRTRTSELAYPEARSAFARLHRNGALDDEYLGLVVGWLDEDFREGSYDPILPDAEVCKRAGELAQRHSLKAYDAVQLATALHLRSSYREGQAGNLVYFFTFDASLRRAARAEERLRVYEPPTDDDGDDQAGGGKGPEDEA